MRTFSFIGRIAHPTSSFFLFMFLKGFICVISSAEITGTFKSGDNSEAIIRFLRSVWASHCLCVGLLLWWFYFVTVLKRISSEK